MLGADEAQNRSSHEVHKDPCIGVTQQVSLEKGERVLMYGDRTAFKTIRKVLATDDNKL
jgi:hypothetical protein